MARDYHADPRARPGAGAGPARPSDGARGARRQRWPGLHYGRGSRFAGPSDRARGGAATRGAFARRAARSAAPGDRVGVLRRPEPERDRGRVAGAVGDGQDAHAGRHAEATRLARCAAPGRWTVTDHQWSELAAPYALGALAPDERERFEAHLAECAACRGEVHSLREVAVLLADAAPAATLPSGLRDRILREARQIRPLRSGRAPVIPWLAAAASLVLAVGLGYMRSEEHTPELQSRPHLVCRLLLDKKNNHRLAFENFSAKQKIPQHDAHRKNDLALISDLEIPLLRSHEIVFTRNNLSLLIGHKAPR